MARIEVKMCLAVLLALSTLTQSAVPDETAPWKFTTSIGGSYDDNRDGTADDKTGLFELSINSKAEYAAAWTRTKLALSYAPSLRYRSNPRHDQNATDLYHLLSLVASHRMSARLGISAGNNFSYTDDPAVMEAGRTFRENATYWLNTAHLAASYRMLGERAAATLEGSFMLKRYEGQDFARIGDEDRIGAAFGLKYALRAGLTAAGSVSFAGTALGTDYDGVERGSDVTFISVSLERVYRCLTARARGGLSLVNLDNASIDSQTRPGGDIQLVYVTPSGKTSLDLAIRHHAVRGDVAPYASQDRTSASLTARRQLRRNLSMSLSGIYALGDYDADTVALNKDGTVVDASKIDGTDQLGAVLLALTYDYRSNLKLCVSYGFEDWSADDHIRKSHRRNTASISVRAEF